MVTLGYGDIVPISFRKQHILNREAYNKKSRKHSRFNYLFYNVCQEKSCS